MTDYHTLLIGSYTNDQMFFHLYFGTRSALISKYLYKHIGVDLHLYDSRQRIAYNQFQFVVSQIGSTYETMTNYRDIALSLEEDVSVMCNAYDVITMWRGHVPNFSITTRHTIHELPSSSLTDYYYIFYCNHTNTSTIIDGECVEFRNLMQDITKHPHEFPSESWQLVYYLKKDSMFTAILYNPEIKLQFFKSFDNQNFSDHDALVASIESFYTLYKIPMHGNKKCVKGKPCMTIKVCESRIY